MWWLRLTYRDSNVNVYLAIIVGGVVRGAGLRGEDVHLVGVADR